MSFKKNFKMPRQGIYLVGAMKNQILGSKLPSNQDCLSVLFNNMRNVRLNLSEAANLVIDECEIFWRKARIPTKDKSDSVKKLKKLYEEWRNLEKSCKRRTDNQQGKEKAFSEKLNNLFDIAHANALNIMSIEKDKQFLIAQRKPNRVGSMLGIDNKITAAEKRKAVTEKKKELEKQKLQAEKEKNQTYGK